MLKRLLLSAAAISLLPITAVAAGNAFKADLSGAQEVPSVMTETSGDAKFRVNTDESEIVVDLTVTDGDGLLGVAGAHIHCGLVGNNGPVVAFLAGVYPGGLDGDLRIRLTINNDNLIGGTDCGTTIGELVRSFRAGMAYVNVHSVDYPGGVVRGQIYQSAGNR